MRWKFVAMRWKYRVVCRHCLMVRYRTVSVLHHFRPERYHCVAVYFECEYERLIFKLNAQK